MKQKRGKFFEGLKGFLFLLLMIFLLPAASGCGNARECDLLFMDFRNVELNDGFLNIFYIRESSGPAGPGENIFLSENVLFTKEGIVLSARAQGTGAGREKYGAEFASLFIPASSPPVRYTAEFMPSPQTGVVSSFFTYLFKEGEFFNNEEIDFEVLRSGDGVPRVYTTTWRRYDPSGISTLKETKWLDVDEDFFSSFHTFTFEWREDAVVFYVDGRKVAEHTGVLPGEGGYVHFNLWWADEWAGGEFEGSATAVYRRVCVEKIREQ